MKRTTIPIEIVAELPIACIARKAISADKLGERASPMLEARYTMKVPMKTGRRPTVSAHDPQKEGAMPWKIM